MLSHSLGDGFELRSLDPWHHREFAEFLDRSRDYLSPWLPWTSIVTGEEAAKQWLYDRAFKRVEDAFHMYGIWQGERLAGGVVFRIFDTGMKMCEIGAWLGPDFTGRGLMTRACVHMIDWAVRERGMNRVEWRCEPANTRSRAVAKRLGMTLDGTLRQAYVNTAGDFVDAEVWSILADEWMRR